MGEGSTEFPLPCARVKFDNSAFVVFLDEHHVSPGAN